MAPIRDVNDAIVMRTAIIGEADLLCTDDEDFLEAPAIDYLQKLGIAVIGDAELMRRLRTSQGSPSLCGFIEFFVYSLRDEGRKVAIVQ